MRSCGNRNLRFGSGSTTTNAEFIHRISGLVIGTYIFASLGTFVIFKDNQFLSFGTGGSVDDNSKDS